MFAPLVWSLSSGRPYSCLQCELKTLYFNVWISLFRKETHIKNTCILWSHRSKLASLWTIKILKGNPIRFIFVAFIRLTNLKSFIYLILYFSSGHSHFTDLLLMIIHMFCLFICCTRYLIPPIAMQIISWLPGLLGTYECFFLVIVFYEERLWW